MPIDNISKLNWQPYLLCCNSSSYAPTNVPYPTVLQIIRNKCELQTFPQGVTSHCDTVLGLVLTSWSLGGAGLETGGGESQ